MSAPKTGMLLLVERLANGTTRRIPLEAAQAMIAAPGARYALIDASTNSAPRGVVLKRKGNMLAIELGDEQVAQIDAFYQQPDAAFVPDATLGAGDAIAGTAVTAATPLQQGSTSVVWSAGDAAGGYAFQPALAGIGLGGLVLAAAGGGGGGGDGGSEEPAPPAATSRVVGKIVMGPVTAGNGLTVIVYQADGKTVLGEAKVQADGSFALDVGDYVGVVIARVVDASAGADYLDEATGAGKDLSAQLFSMETVREPNTTVVMNINVLTTLAYHKAVEAADGAPLTPSQVSAANQAIAELFGLDSLQGLDVVPVNGGDFDDSDGYSQGEIYGALLAAFSGADVANGGDTQATIDQILAGLSFRDGKATLSKDAQAALIEGAREAGATLEGGIAGLVDTYAPEFSAQLVTVSLAENSPAGALVHTAQASDPSSVRYALAGPDAKLFAIDAATGAVTLKGQADHEARSSYSFTVVATDTAGNSSSQAVTLQVGNLDEVAPVITSGAVATAIDENSGAGQVVYVATADDSADVSGGVTFSLKDIAPPPPARMMAMAPPSLPPFTIDATTGAVTLTEDPDHEWRSSYSFIVVATDAAGNSSEQLVTLDINDLDEAAPTITSGATAATIAENVGANQVVYTVAATDDDDISAGVTYSLKAGGDAAAFSIDPVTGAVRLLANPDFEAKPSYTFTVVATDGAGLSDEQAVTLAIGNVDDTAPTITSGATATAIDENTGASQVVYTAQATDTGDVASGLTYSLKNVGDFAAFSIDPATGAVTLTANPDHETKASYSFTVVATDGAGLSDEQAVTLAIGNVDDTAPTITSGATATAIDENTGASQVVYTAQATDTGDVASGLTYSLKNVGDFAAFSIDPATGAVTLTANPDHETKASYSFTVVATDGAGLSDEQAVTLAIGNVDDTAPAFISPPVALPLIENTGANQPVYTAMATDTGDVASGLTYSLQATGDFAAFTIDPQTGVVTLAANPDFESKSSYTFTVVATDGAGLSAQQMVTLPIINVDDTAPTIISPATATTIAENTGSNQVVYQAVATDIGDVPSGLSYSLKNSGDVGQFSIDVVTGAVTLAPNPDYETKSSYTFTVVATDGAGLSDEQAVTLAIGNVDDTAPTITSGATATAIDENTGASQVVYTAQATDTGDVASGLTYSLKNVGDFAAFSIDPVTGAVTLSANPDHETKASYSFTVVATDGAGLSDEQAVTLAIGNVDDTAPTITSGATATIAENVGPNQVVYQATATDTADIPSGLTYSLKNSGDVGQFSIDVGTGEVRLVPNPDYETKSSYSFTVVATDGAGLKDERTVTLAISDVDDTAPTIAGMSFSANGDSGGRLDAGDQIVLNYEFTEAVTVDTSGGSPRLALQIGGTTVYAAYAGGSGTDTLTFSYTIAAGQNDADGVSIPANAIALSGGTIRDAAGNDASLSFGASDIPTLIVDTDAPTLSSSLPADDATAFAVDGNIVLTFSESVQAGSGNIVISNGIDVRTIAITDAQVTIAGSTVTINPTANLQPESTYHVQMTSGVLTDAAGNAFAGISDATTLNFETKAAIDTSIVVFDMLQGVSSDHSGRTFQADTTYTIYLRVDSNNVALSTDGTATNPSATWGTWSGANNLGADDKIMLVGTGTQIKGVSGAWLDRFTADVGGVGQDYALWWGSGGSGTWAGVTVQDNGSLSRYTNWFGGWDGATLWTGAQWDGLNAGRGFAEVHLLQMPANVLTSQGLA